MVRGVLGVITGAIAWMAGFYALVIVLSALWPDFALHGRKNGHKPRVTLPPGINQHQIRHQPAETLQAAELKLHAAAEENGAGAGIDTKGRIHGADCVAERGRVEVADILGGYAQA